MSAMTCECGKPAEPGRTECFRCRVSSVGFTFRGGALPGKSGWNRSVREWKNEHLGSDDDRVLESRGIVRQDRL